MPDLQAQTCLLLCGLLLWNGLLYSELTAGTASSSMVLEMCRVKRALRLAHQVFRQTKNVLNKKLRVISVGKFSINGSGPCASIKREGISKCCAFQRRAPQGYLLAALCPQLQPPQHLSELSHLAPMIIPSLIKSILLA